MKKCNKCNTIKELKEFHVNNKCKTRRAASCKSCMKEYNKMHNRLKLYGLTEEKSRELEQRANGLCEICGRPQRHVSMGQVVSLCIDHNHSTGKVRGMLCNDCNKFIGMFGEDISLMDKVVTNTKIYLERHK